MKLARFARLKTHQVPIALGFLASVGVLMLRSLGGLQLLELRSLDALMAHRPAETVDDRLVIVGISEADLNWLRSPVLTDEKLAELLQRLNQHRPRIIGLDFYRSLPTGPGTEELYQIFRETPNLISIEKVITDEADRSQARLPGNSIMAAADRVAASDVIVDPDGRVRRALLFPAATGPRILEGLGFRIALDYLAQEQIWPDPEAHELQLGNAGFPPFRSNLGGYVGANSGGYQILLNSRAGAPIPMVSLRQVLTDQIPADLIRDRAVFIGSTALSSADVFYSTHSNAENRDARVTFGVELHAELASQVISRVLDGRPLLQSLPEPLEIVLIVGVAYVGVGLQRSLIAEWQRWSGAGLFSVATATASYGALVSLGLWLPLVPLLLSFWTASVFTLSQRMIQLRQLAEFDGLTQLANRRTFDEQLQQRWLKGLQSGQSISLILCDVDHFKLYNDAYGHQQGDECLRHVAKVIRSVVKRRMDLAARYGGEEFVVLLPDTSAEAALQLAEKIRRSIKAAKLPHKASKVSDHVTLSLGVTCLVPSMEVPMSSLVQFADLGLYRAKEAGRDRANLHLPTAA